MCDTFGMKHCIYYTCLMNGSNGYHQTLIKDSHLCPICIRKLQYAIGFDFMERYERMTKLGDEKSQILTVKIQEALNDEK